MGLQSQNSDGTSGVGGCHLLEDLHPVGELCTSKRCVQTDEIGVPTRRVAAAHLVWELGMDQCQLGTTIEWTELVANGGGCLPVYDPGVGEVREWVVLGDLSRDSALIVELEFDGSSGPCLNGCSGRKSRCDAAYGCQGIPHSLGGRRKRSCERDHVHVIFVGECSYRSVHVHVSSLRWASSLSRRFCQNAR